jgi:nicotinate phosphoribosyltransferase
MAYKLVEYEGRPVLKLSAGKVSLPGEKQVFRSLDGAGKFSHDTLALRHEDPEDGVPILQKVMEGGRATGQPPTLGEIRERFRQDFNRLDDRLKALRDPPQYQVKLSPQLEELARRIEQERLAEQVGRDPVETQGYDGREGV